MTILNREEIIKAIAQSIRFVNLYGDFDPHEYIEGSRKLAEAALNALIDALPETPKSSELMSAWESGYKQLLALKRE